MNRIDLLQLFSAITMFLFSLVAFYVAGGLFERWDNLDKTISKIELITKDLDETASKIQKVIPDTLGDSVKKSSEGFINGIRDGLNKKDAQGDNNEN